MMFDYAHIAWKDVFGHRVRSLLSVGGIAVIVAVFLVLTSVATGLASIMSGSEGSARNLALIDRGVVDFCQGSISDTAVRHLRRWPELTAVAPMLHTVIQLDGRMTQVRAVPLDNYQAVENVTILEGEGLKRGDYAIAGYQVARMNDWQVGDRIEIGQTEVEIVGLFRGPGALSTEVWLTLDDGQRILGRGDGYSIVVIQVADGQDPRAIEARLRESPFLTRQVDIKSEKAVYDTMNQSFKQIEEVMGAVSVLALVAIVFGIFNVVSMTVAEKGREIGVLRAIGLSRAEVTRIYLMEGVIQAALGYAAGLALGMAAVTVLPNMSGVSFASIPLNPVLKPTTVAWSLALTLALTWLGARFPARRAA
ncbi:MAG TPA: ABC transporter permease, partial [Anaerolineae bacterium]|nr:ABC transporter permease [Anaerolineae bacterium]